MSEHPSSLFQRSPSLYECWLVESSFWQQDLFLSLHRTSDLNLSSQSISTHNSPPLPFSLRMYTYQPQEIPVGWPQPDVWSLVFIKGPDSLLEPLLMERGEAGLHTQDQMLQLPLAVMSWLGAQHWCLPFLNHHAKQWYDWDVRRKEWWVNKWMKCWKTKSMMAFCIPFHSVPNMACYFQPVVFYFLPYVRLYFTSARH